MITNPPFTLASPVSAVVKLYHFLIVLLLFGAKVLNCSVLGKGVNEFRKAKMNGNRIYDVMNQEPLEDHDFKSHREKVMTAKMRKI